MLRKSSTLWLQNSRLTEVGFDIIKGLNNNLIYLAEIVEITKHVLGIVFLNLPC